MDRSQSPILYGRGFNRLDPSKGSALFGRRNPDQVEPDNWQSLLPSIAHVQKGHNLKHLPIGKNRSISAVLGKPFRKIFTPRWLRSRHHTSANSPSLNDATCNSINQTPGDSIPLLNNWTSDSVVKHHSAPLPMDFWRERPSNPSTDFELPDQKQRHKVAIAVDVSTSTQHGILDIEKEVILELCTAFNVFEASEEHRSEASVIPWSSVANEPIRPDEMDALTPHWGTFPNTITKSSSSAAVLQESSVWCLLTDGFIDYEQVVEFEQGIQEIGIHGTASVTILFGHKPIKPMMCNISVGSAVFAVAPHCLFAYHDIDSRRAFILQCKGCFRDLIPSKGHITITDLTTWLDLPFLNYRMLKGIRVPQPSKLSPNDIALSGIGKSVNLQDLYENRLTADEVKRILDSDDDIKTLLLTSQFRGDIERAEKWIIEQGKDKIDATLLQRPDEFDEGYNLIKKAVDLQLLGKYPPFVERHLQLQLRLTHDRNWQAFSSLIRSLCRDVSERQTLVEGALKRIELAKAGCATPALLSPVTPNRSRPPPEFHSERNYAEESSRQENRDLHNNLGVESNSSGSSDATEASIYLYTTGYVIETGLSKFSPFIGFCAMCGGYERPLALLLCAPPQLEKTENFPPPGSRFQSDFPLEMGNFPETDILSTFVCCETCSFFVVRYGKSPLDHKIIGALPLIPLSREQNRKTFTNTIFRALDGRFDILGLDLIFLGILHAGLSFQADKSPIFAKCISWLFQEVAKNAKAPCNFITQQNEGSGYLPFLSTEISLQIRNLKISPLPPLLTLPLESFILLISVADNLQIATELGESISRIIFCRLVYSIIESLFSEFANWSSTEVEVNLSALTRGYSNLKDLHNAEATTRPRGTSESQLSALYPIQDTYLLPKENVILFSRLGRKFDFIQKTSYNSIREVLLTLESVFLQCTHASECFYTVQSRIPTTFLSPFDSNR